MAAGGGIVGCRSFGHFGQTGGFFLGHGRRRALGGFGGRPRRAVTGNRTRAKGLSLGHALQIGLGGIGGRDESLLVVVVASRQAGFGFFGRFRADGSLGSPGCTHAVGGRYVASFGFAAQDSFWFAGWTLFHSRLAAIRPRGSSFQGARAVGFGSRRQLAAIGTGAALLFGSTGVVGRVAAFQERRSRIGHVLDDFFFVLHALATGDPLRLGGHFSTAVGDFFLVVFPRVPLPILFVQDGIVTIALVLEACPLAGFGSQLQSASAVLGAVVDRFALPGFHHEHGVLEGTHNVVVILGGPPDILQNVFGHAVEVGNAFGFFLVVKGDSFVVRSSTRRALFLQD